VDPGVQHLTQWVDPNRLETRTAAAHQGWFGEAGQSIGVDVLLEQPGGQVAAQFAGALFGAVGGQNKISESQPKSRLASQFCLLSAHLAANFREFQNHLLRAGSTSVGPCFPQDFSRFSAQTRVVALDTIASYRA